MSSYRDGRPWDGGPPGAEQDYSGQQYSAPVPATDPWTGVSYAQYANYDYSAYGHGYNYGYDPTYYQHHDNYYGRSSHASYGMHSSNPVPGGSSSKSYRSRSRSRSHYSRRERSYSRSRGSVNRSRSRSRSRKTKLKRYSRSSSRSYSRSPIKVKKERLTPSPTSKKQVVIKKEKKSPSKSRSGSMGPKNDKYLSKDTKILSNKTVKQTLIKKERNSISPQKATSSKPSRAVSSPKCSTPEKSKMAKLNKHKCHTPPIKERSVTPPKCYARSRSVSASSSRSSSRSSRLSKSSRASASRSRSRSPRIAKNKMHRKRTVSRSSSGHRATLSRSRSNSRRRITKSRSSSTSARHNARSRSISRHRSRSVTRRRPGKSRSTSRRRSDRSVSKPRRNSSHSPSKSRSRSRSKSRQKAGKTASKSRRSRSNSRDRRSSVSRSRSRSDDDERRGQFTVADRKRFWKRHRSRIEDKVKTPPQEVIPPPGAVETTKVDDIEYGVPPEVDGPNFADMLGPKDQEAPSTSKKAPLPIKNDGSFLEMFKKMQEETKKAEDAEKKPEIKKPILPFIGKRRGGRVLKTGLVKKARAIDEQAADAPKDAWSLYMREVKKYRETSCEEERKTRPLVK